MITNNFNIFWYRRDLRIEDNIGLFKALQGKFPVVPIFIFDQDILHQLPKEDARVTFLHETLDKIKVQFKNLNSDLWVIFGKPLEVFKTITKNHEVKNVITNRDYEPYALERDTAIKAFLESVNVGFFTFKDQVIFETNEVVKTDGNPYVVYTPYSKLWLEKIKTTKVEPVNPSPYFNNLKKFEAPPLPKLEEMGFTKSSIKVIPYHIEATLIEKYQTTRNFPALKEGTSNLSPHLRFGTIGIRSLVKKALIAKNNTFLKELIWREFFMQILWHFPQTPKKAFKPIYDRIEWNNNETDFQHWKNGTTGYPLVDAGMRQLNKTGYMHNRVRMLVASFLCKHLLIDWRWGEAYFAEKLLDYEMSSNVGNWQWAAGSGVDAAPYFRIFNPTTQIEKFDKDYQYIKMWVPEVHTLNYAKPIVEHKWARERCLNTYKQALNA